jgi:hypothetical protein
MGFELYSTPHKAQELLAAHSHTLPSYYLPNPSQQVGMLGKPVKAKEYRIGVVGSAFRSSLSPLTLGKVVNGIVLLLCNKRADMDEA